LRKLLLKLLDKSRFYTLAKPFYSGIGHILIFHRVCPDNGIEKSIWCKGIEVTPAYLEMVIKYFLDQKYEVVSLDQLVMVLNSKKVDKKYVVFTFDDGYVDNFTFAYPIFKKYNIPFTIYITSGFIDRQAIMWWHSLSDLLFDNKKISFELDNKKYDFDCSTIEGKERAYLNIGFLLRGCNESELADKAGKIFNLFKIDAYKKTDELVLSWDQIKKLNKDPLVTIGAHTINHLVLKNLSGADVKKEILGSKTMLESQLNYEIKHFAYPNGGRGEVEKREFEIAKESGFITATTTRSANVFLEHRNHLECLPRFDMAEGIGHKELQFLTSGLTHCLRNRFKRVITL